MAGYRKKVSYLDYLENGMKIRNAGFVKMEERDGQTRLEIQVKNIPEQFGGLYELKADGGGTVERISLQRGGGSCCAVWQRDREQEPGRRKVLTNGIYIRLPGRRLVQTVWPQPWELSVEFAPEETHGPGAEEKGLAEPEAEEEKKAEPEEERETEPAMDTVQEEAQRPETSESPEEEPEGEEPERVSEEETKERRIENEGTERARERSVNPIWRVEMEPEMTIDSRTEKEEEEPVCYGDKWEQLSHMYPHLHPFEDEREYLSISPKDFVVLRQEYQKMVHNSFLLHGYYNYKHLILGKIPAAGEWHYYLGVPGNFYNREKMVAEMFGFEAFEGEKEPVQAGDFGYFMKRVEI